MFVGSKAWNWIKLPRLSSIGRCRVATGDCVGGVRTSHSYCGSLVPRPATSLVNLINPPRRQIVNKSHCFGPNRAVCRCPVALAGARGVSHLWLRQDWPTWGSGSVAQRKKDEPLLSVSSLFILTCHHLSQYSLFGQYTVYFLMKRYLAFIELAHFCSSMTISTIYLHQCILEAILWSVHFNEIELVTRRTVNWMQ